MKRFPSIQQLCSSVIAVGKRFPLPLFFTFLATVSGLLLTYNFKDYQTTSWLIKGVYLGNLGLALSLALALYSENRNIAGSKKTAGNLLILILLTGIGLFTNPFKKEADILILLILAFAFHLLVAISAFSASDENNGFWQLNKNFFLKFATSVLYSVVLFAGLSIALLSISTLFSINWKGEIYFRLWIIIAGLFNTLFFLSHISNPIQQLNSDTSYPKGLKIFTQYVLIPLASIYLLILLAYEIKIVANWELPNGTVSILILGYAVFGILSLLLVHPLRNDEESKWITLFSKWFYYLMIPLLILLILAIYKRVGNYGITESRYILMALATWLGFITLYFLIKGQEQIRIIPISLMFIALIITFGPWGITHVSKNSQQNRLAKILKEKASPKRNNEIRNLVTYLSNNHGINSLQEFVKQDLQKINNELEAKADTSSHNNFYLLRQNAKDTVLAMLKISKDYEAEDLGIDSDQVKYFHNTEEDVLDVSGAEKIIVFNSITNLEDKKSKTFTVDKDRFTISQNSIKNIKIQSDFNLDITFKIDSLIESLHQSKHLKEQSQNPGNFDVSLENMSIKKETDKYIFVCRLEQINGNRKASNINKGQNIFYYSGYIIVYKK